LPADYLREVTTGNDDAQEAKPGHGQKPVAPSKPSLARIVGSDGKEIRNAQYAPVNPNDL
jgi:hypothetical protein